MTNFGLDSLIKMHQHEYYFYKIISNPTGREYDKNGNMNQWWKNETIARFKNRTQCMVEQYSQFKLGNLTVNGRQTLGKTLSQRNCSLVTTGTVFFLN